MGLLKKFFRGLTGEGQRDTVTRAGIQARAQLQSGFDEANAFISPFADRSAGTFRRLVDGTGPDGEFSQGFQSNFNPNDFAFGPAQRVPGRRAGGFGGGRADNGFGGFPQRANPQRFAPASRFGVDPRGGAPTAFAPRLGTPFSSAGFDFRADPAYQFRLDQGRAAIDRGAASRGKALSGQAARELAQFGQNLASEEFGRARNRALEENRLAYDRSLGQNELAFNRALQDDIRREQRFNQTDTRRYDRLANLANTQIQVANRLAAMRNALGGNLANSFTGTAAALNKATDLGVGRITDIIKGGISLASQTGLIPNKKPI